MNDILKGVAGSLLAMLIGAIVIQLKTRSLLRWHTFVLFWNLARRFHDNGVANFFASRADYSKFRKEPSASEYIRGAQHELFYVGFWLAEGTEIDAVVDALRWLLGRGCTVELTFLTEHLSDEAQVQLSEHLGLPRDACQSRLITSWATMKEFRTGLPPALQPRLILRAHRQQLNSSAFLIDPNAPSGRTLVDFKLFGMGRERSFGIELRRQGNADNLYRRITESFLMIKNKAAVVS